MQSIPLSSQQNQKSSTSIEIFLTIAQMGNVSRESLSLFSLEEIPLFTQIREKVKKREKLTFILPAFPAKSANRNKTHSPLPDMGEVLTLQSLNQLCQSIETIYPPSAEVVICSDGRVFNDLVMVSDQALQVYKDKIREIIETFSLKHLQCYDLENYFEKQINHSDYSAMRKELIKTFAPSIDDIRDQVKREETARLMFCGLHRFIKEDLVFFYGHLSKNKVAHTSKQLTYQVIQRSQAWDKLLNQKYQQALRFSIHPYPINHPKFGIRLIKGEGRWATPWHNVTLKTPKGYFLLKRAEALKLKAKVHYLKGIYAFYEVS